MRWASSPSLLADIPNSNVHFTGSRPLTWKCRLWPAATSRSLADQIPGRLGAARIFSGRAFSLLATAGQIAVGSRFSPTAEPVGKLRNHWTEIPLREQYLYLTRPLQQIVSQLIATAVAPVPVSR